jgi:tetrapyrrole methylase family protein/MazG family protein
LQAEEAVAQATERFIKRFSYVETRLHEAGESPSASLEVMDRLWDQAKELERKEKTEI